MSESRILNPDFKVEPPAVETVKISFAEEYRRNGSYCQLREKEGMGV
jgi:hypothetical protein